MVHVIQVIQIDSVKTLGIKFEAKHSINSIHFNIHTSILVFQCFERLHPSKLSKSFASIQAANVKSKHVSFRTLDARF